MTSNVRQFFSRLAESKRAVASRIATEQGVCVELLKKLQRTVSGDGIVRVFADHKSRWLAHHLNEELVVRFKAGALFKRPDRGAINSRQYCDYAQADAKNIAALLKNFSSGDLLIYLSAGPSETQSMIINAASAQSIPIATIGVLPGADETEKVDFAFGDYYREDAQRSLFQRVCLHAICESLEPESKGAFDLIPALHASADLDDVTVADAARLGKIESVVSAFKELEGKKRTIFVAGNGGSTCDANEFADRLRSLPLGFDLIDLHSPDILLCSYNDGYPVFARQIEACGQSGDILLVFSTSGNSKNIVEAVTLARSRGLIVIGLLGRGGGASAALCDFSIVVPSDATERIQEVHSAVCWAIAESMIL